MPNSKYDLTTEELLLKSQTMLPLHFSTRSACTVASQNGPLQGGTYISAPANYATNPVFKTVCFAPLRFIAEPNFARPFPMAC